MQMRHAQQGPLPLSDPCYLTAHEASHFVNNWYLSVLYKRFRTYEDTRDLEIRKRARNNFVTCQSGWTSTFAFLRID